MGRCRKEKYSVGDILICPIEVENPYTDYLMGEDRVYALRWFKDGVLPQSLCVWYAPEGGTAKRVTSASKVDWR